MITTKLSDNFYDKIKPRLYQRIGKKLRSAYHVLDLGCGACELAEYLSETYGQKVIGVDISADSFPNNRSITKNTKLIHCVRKDAARLDFIQNETIDAVVMFWSLHEMNNPQVVLQEAYRVLKPAGKILVVEFPRNSLAQRLWNENYYSKQELMAYLRKAGFKDIQARFLEHKQILWVSGYHGTKGTNESDRIKVKVYEA